IYSLNCPYLVFRESPVRTQVTDGHETFEFLAGELTLRAVFGGRKGFVVVNPPYVKKLALNLVGNALSSGLPGEVCRSGLGDEPISAAALFERLENTVRPDNLPDFLSDLSVVLRFRVAHGECSNLFEVRLPAAVL